ncbi:MAG: nucleotide exchange factor GrpE, partial [Gemmataceae bacterium]
KESKADYENAHQRNAREREQERQFRASGLAADLLPAIDNMERAMAAAKDAHESGPLVQGIALVHGQLLDALKRHGITRIEAAGQPFDPHQHQAVMQQPAADQPPNTVIQVLEQGYMIHDRVLRAAKVIVSTQPTA